MGRALRERVAWYGDVDLIPHLLRVLSSGAIDVTVSWGEAISLRHERRSQGDHARFRKISATHDHPGAACAAATANPIAAGVRAPAATAARIGLTCA